jgi:hypothetical protein
MNVIFIETPGFIAKIDSIAADNEFIAIQNELLGNPTKGKIVKDTGGARKVRMKFKGTGKSSGARIIYYYVDLKGEIWFLDIYSKKDKENLTENEKKKIFRFIKEVING